MFLTVLHTIPIVLGDSYAQSRLFEAEHRDWFEEKPKAVMEPPITENVVEEPIASEPVGEVKGIAKLTRKGELDRNIAIKDEEAEALKRGLSGIVRRYGFANVQEFYNTFRISEDAYRRYQRKTIYTQEVKEAKGRDNSPLLAS